MEILFLGTGAADWNHTHREQKGYRRNSSALIDGVLLIDPGPDVPEALEKFSADASRIRYILNTHRHSDHYCEETLESLLSSGAEFFDLAAGDAIQLGGYTVCAYRGNHGTCAETVHFLISDGKSRLFYGLDGAWLMYEEVQAIQEHGVDFAVLDGTVGEKPGDYRIFEHNNLAMVREMKKTLGPFIGRVCISHLARTLHEPHEQVAAAMAKDGIEVAFDGWKTTF